MLLGTGGHTISFWYYPTSFNASFVDVLIHKAVGASQPQWKIYIVNSTHYLTWVTYNGTTEYALTGTTALVANTWYYIVCTRSNTGVKTIYVNGSLYSSGSDNNINIDNSSYPLTIGVSGVGYTDYVNGIIKDLMIFRQALSQDQIAALMAETYIN